MTPGNCRISLRVGPLFLHNETRTPGILGTLVAILTMFFNEPGVKNSMVYFRSAWILGERV